MVLQSLINFSALSKQSPSGWGLPQVDLNAVTLSNVLNTFYFFAGVIAVILIVYAGFLFVTSAGDSGKVAKAKNTITAAVIGLVIIMLAFVITRFVAGIAG